LYKNLTTTHFFRFDAGISSNYLPLVKFGSTLSSAKLFFSTTKSSQQSCCFCFFPEKGKQLEARWGEKLQPLPPTQKLRPKLIRKDEKEGQ
jgi:hypothetical protein